MSRMVDASDPSPGQQRRPRTSVAPKSGAEATRKGGSADGADPTHRRRVREARGRPRPHHRDRVRPGPGSGRTGWERRPVDHPVGRSGRGQGRTRSDVRAEVLEPGLVNERYEGGGAEPTAGSKVST